MSTFFSALSFVSNQPVFLLVVKLFAFVFKSILLINLLRFKSRAQTTRHLWRMVSLLLAASAMIEFVWLIKLLRVTLILPLSICVTFTLTRIGWICSIVEYTSLLFFIDYLIQRYTPRLQLNGRQIIACLGACLFIGLLVVFIIVYASCPERPPIEFTLYKIIYFYLLAILVPTFYRAITLQSRGTLPKILSLQLKTFMVYGIIPHTIFEFGAFNPFSFSSSGQNGLYSFISLSTLAFSYGLYFSARKMMALRFLNVKNHVDIIYDSNFVKDFKDILEQLAHMTNTKQISHLIQQFFKKTFAIPIGKATLYLRNQDAISIENKSIVALGVENLLTISPDAKSFQAFLMQSKILIRDELEFTYFYEPTQSFATAIAFLHSINASIFLPIYEKNSIIGYIIVEEYPESANKLFSTTHRDEMLIFASYLGAVINLLAHTNLQAIVQEQKELKEELYHKHQEINKYKESIRSFVRTSHERKIGIIFYKNRRFSFGNQAAQELVNIDLNKEQGHSLSYTFKKIVRDVQEYKAAQTVMTTDIHGNKLMIASILSLESNSVIITVYYPEIAEILQSHSTMLKDPSQWDYLLYLETTESGQLINQLIPGSGENLLDFKINLLKAALSKKAILLDMPPEDLMSTVEIIHHISLKAELSILKLTTPEKSHEVAHKLFGINPHFGPHFGNSLDEPPLLEKINNNGTLFIENVHLLSPETQHSLAEFIHYGFFKPLRSDRKIMSNVRIICSTTQNLEALANQGHFSATLMQALSHMNVKLPHFTELEKQELHGLVDGYLKQAVKSNEFHSLLQLTDKERNSLIDQQPLSLQELKEHIHYLIMQKANKKKINEVTIDAISSVTEPELHAALRLGKHALKDARIMSMLWNKFKNQTKIATLLGVNRSSVNRRCKEYNLL